jgi:hypothetical protein
MIKQADHAKYVHTKRVLLKKIQKVQIIMHSPWLRVDLLQNESETKLHFCFVYLPDPGSLL